MPHSIQSPRLDRPFKPLAYRMGVRSLLVCLAAAGTQSVMGAVLAQSSSSTSSAQIEVTVTNVHNTTGKIGCRLFASKEGFPNSDQSYESVLVSIASGHATCLFSNLPSGTYAVAVMHDENGNGHLDTNLFGIPEEGYGVSNNHTHAMSSPKWDESYFMLTPGERKQLEIQIRY